ncbi:MAG: hypothetical protein KY468_18795 [Armatimonadetes bacterium]|nr:hypothetical protein [Armatimonadota bacterium]
MLEFDIRYEGHGWLWTTLTAPSFNLEFPASDVPYDSIIQLTDAILSLLTYQGPAVVLWNSEPIEHEFRFHRDVENVHLTVVEFPDERRTMNAGDAIGDVTGSITGLLSPFVGTLQRLADNENFRNEWDWDFPAERLQRIQRLMEQLV